MIEIITNPLAMVLVATVIGALCGVATGLIPGIHVNTVVALLLAGSASFAAFGVEFSASLAFTCALAISHTFFDVVPGMFLGVPGDEGFALLPGHRLVRSGHGIEAIQLSIWGSVTGLVFGLAVIALLFLPDFNLLDWLEGTISPWMFWILAAVAAILTITDSRRGWSLVILLASGLLGIFVFGSPLVAGGADASISSLFPALAGLFGVAGLLFSIFTANESNEAAEKPGRTSGEPPTVSVVKVRWPGVRGGMAGMLVGLLPGMGSANAATMLLLAERRLGRRRRREDEDRAYLVTTSSLNTSEALFAIAALYLIERTRSGASIAVDQILRGDILREDFAWMALSVVLGGALAALIMSRCSRGLANFFVGRDEKSLNWGVIAFLLALTVLLLGVGGLVVLICASILGLTPLIVGVRRAQLMGFFLVPAMLYYSGFQRQVVDFLGVAQRTSPLMPDAVTLPEIGVSVVIASALALATYLLASRVSSANEGGVAPVATATGVFSLTAALLVLALSGRAYPPTPEVWPDIEPENKVAGRIIKAEGDIQYIASLGRRFRVRFAGVVAPDRCQLQEDQAPAWEAGKEQVIWSAKDIGSDGVFSGLVQDETIRGRIVRVIDGDTANVVSDGLCYSIRFQGVGAPERGESGFTESRDWVTSMLDGREASVTIEDIDRFNRIVGRIYLQDGLDVNSEIIRRGYAPAYPNFPFDDLDEFLRLEQEARAEGRGLWSLEIAGPEGGFQASSRSSSSDIPEEIRLLDDNDNGRISCDEARRHGIAPVNRSHPAYGFMNDADGDGVVCE